MTDGAENPPLTFERFKAGAWRKQYQYRSFEPVPVNREWTWSDPRINTLLESANRALGELNAFSLIVPDVDFFIYMHVVKEAQTSSRIEGAHTDIDGAVTPQEHIDPEKRDDWQEVHNYIQAMNSAIGELEDLPLSSRLLRNAHEILMQGVRGQHKQPGEFRKSQNWIGGSGPSDAVYVPPHPDSVPDLMSDLEGFWHNQDITVPHLIRVGIGHYQFETIHPFLDGNGRIGRLMIPLYLVNHGLLAQPSLYLSDFFEKNRASYYDALMRVRVSNDLIHWVRFFLNGVATTARKGRDVFQAILALRAESEQRALSLGKRGQNALRLLKYLFVRPIVDTDDLVRELSISKQTAHTLLLEFERLGILREITGRQRSRMFAFRPYLDLFRS